MALIKYAQQLDKTIDQKVPYTDFDEMAKDLAQIGDHCWEELSEEHKDLFCSIALAMVTKIMNTKSCFY